MMTGACKKMGLAAAVLALIVFPVNGGGAEKLPRPYGYVNDFAGVMEEETVEELNGALEELSDMTGAQVVVIILTSIRNETAEQFSKRAMREWSAGGEPLTHVILLVIGLEGRKVWIEAGAGLEGVAPRPERDRIVFTIMAPLLKRGDLDQGVRAGVREIESLIVKKYNITPGNPRIKTRKAGSAHAVPGGGARPVLPKIIILFILIPTASIIVLTIGKRIFISFFSDRRHGMNGGPGGDEFGGGFGGFGGGMKGV